MKKIGLLLFAVIIGMAACKKDDENQIDNSAPLSERLPGYWNITAVKYSGQLPNSQNPNQGVPFAGEGESVSGYFNFDADTNTGEFDINFVAKIDIGLSQPLSVTVNENRGGLWEPINSDAIVKMWGGDTITEWTVLTNLPNSQIWRTSIDLDYGPPYSNVPVDVVATMTRK